MTQTKYFTDKQLKVANALQKIAFIIETDRSDAEKQSEMLEMLSEHEEDCNDIFGFIGQGVKHLDGDLHLGTIIGNVIHFLDVENIRYKLSDIINDEVAMDFHSCITTAYPIIKLYSETNGDGYLYDAEDVDDLYGEHYDTYQNYITEIGNHLLLK